MIDIGEHPEGCVLSVRAQPGARKEGIKGEHGGALKVAVTAPPDRGRANQALVEVLREALGLKQSQIELLSGHTGRQKRFLIRGTTKAELDAKIRQLPNESVS
jgi:uncharacterized protein (TIGR00251 family)